LTIIYLSQGLFDQPQIPHTILKMIEIRHFPKVDSTQASQTKRMVRVDSDPIYSNYGFQAIPHATAPVTPAPVAQFAQKYPCRTGAHDPPAQRPGVVLVLN
jgi:hypothetical protein